VREGLTIAPIKIGIHGMSNKAVADALGLLASLPLVGVASEDEKK